MPWNASDVEGFKKGLSRKQKRKWAAIANGALSSCMEGGGGEKECTGRAVRIANSKFDGRTPFNPVLNSMLKEKIRIMEEEGDCRWVTIRGAHVCLGGGEPSPIGAEELDIGKLPPEQIMRLEGPKRGGKDLLVAAKKKVAAWNKTRGGTEKVSLTPEEVFDPMKFPLNKKIRLKEFSDGKTKDFQFRKQTPPDAMDGHVHEAIYDEDGNGATDVVDDHHHMIFGFKIQNYFYFDPETKEEYSSVHPGSLAFKENKITAAPENGSGEVEMEIFRPGKHNGEDFGEDDLEEIAANFKRLKGEIRPCLKITHRDNQESLAGLMRYGDVVDVFLKKAADGTRRLFAKIANVPEQILRLIKERRFPERSIEIYPEFKLGIKEGSPTYRNVLKAVALLGHEMPAVTGMEPVKLSEAIECQGTACFRECLECDSQLEAQEAIEMAEMILKFQTVMDMESRIAREMTKAKGGET